MNKKAEIDSGNLIMMLLMIIFILLILAVTYFQLDNQIKKENLCESNSMRYVISNGDDYCITGNQLYKIVQVDNNFRLAKEVVTLG